MCVCVCVCVCGLMHNNEIEREKGEGPPFTVGRLLSKVSLFCLVSVGQMDSDDEGLKLREEKADH